ncbi:MAG: SDR family NAD(P)-dependent oxidoreductase, partial [Rhodococcus sp. (in: high G+C Gram-positive bacteria)]
MGNITYDFTGKSVIVTGAARGIGQALARHFAEANATVFMVDFDKVELDKAARDVGAVGIPADASNTDDVERVVSTVIDETG